MISFVSPVPPGISGPHVTRRPRISCHQASQDLMSPLPPGVPGSQASQDLMSPLPPGNQDVVSLVPPGLPYWHVVLMKTNWENRVTFGQKQREPLDTQHWKDASFLPSTLFPRSDVHCIPRTPQSRLCCL